MSPSVSNEKPVVDYSFPWSMAEEEERAAGSLAGERPDQTTAIAGIPLAFRAWVLEHSDELEAVH